MLSRTRLAGAARAMATAAGQQGKLQGKVGNTTVLLGDCTAALGGGSDCQHGRDRDRHCRESRSPRCCTVLLYVLLLISQCRRQCAGQQQEGGEREGRRGEAGGGGAQRGRPGLVCRDKYFVLAGTVQVCHVGKAKDRARLLQTAVDK